jgi:hypothetical protein
MDMAMVGCGNQFGYFNKYEIIEGFYVQATIIFYLNAHLFQCKSQFHLPYFQR